MKQAALLLALVFALPALAKPPRKAKKKPAPAATEEKKDEAPPAEENPPAETPPPEPAQAAPTPPPEPPRAEPAPKPEPKPAAASVDLEKLRQEYEQLRDQLFRSHARAATLSNAMYSTKLTVGMRWKATRHYAVKRAQVRLDESQMWDSGERGVGDDRVKVGEQSVAPGHHELTVRMEVRAKENDKLGYSSEHTFSVDVPEGKKTDIELIADEDGDLPEYKPIVKVEMKSEK